MARNQEVSDDLDEVEPDDIEEETEDTEETPVKRGPGRPKGSKSTTPSNPTKNFHAIVMSKRGAPKHVIVTHVMGKNCRVVSASNPNMDAIRVPVGNVAHYNEEVFEQLTERYNKIANAVDANFGLFKQLKPVNAPKRVAKVVDPIEDL